MKITDKFPEIISFIENPTSYEILYYQDDRIHNEYPLEVSEAKEIFDYIDYLEYMSKKQKESIDKAIEFLKTEYNTYPSAKKWRSALSKILEDKDV